jgi:hypothetical protein
VSYRLYWRHNDGVSGHVWLADDDLRALAGEMHAQGMPWQDETVPAAGAETRLSPGEVEELLAPARVEPETLADPSLWADWLVFLKGAAHNGGLLIRR